MSMLYIDNIIYLIWVYNEYFLKKFLTALSFNATI